MTDNNKQWEDAKSIASKISDSENIVSPSAVLRELQDMEDDNFIENEGEEQDEQE